MNVYRVSIWVTFLIAFLTISAHSVVNAAGGSNTVVTLPGGRVAVFGAVVNGACSVSISNSDKIVLMGSVRSNQFMGVGSDSQAVPFSIQLDDCNSNVSESVGVSFSGIANKEDFQVLAINGGADAAQGIGLALFDADNQLLAVNANPIEYAPLSKGINTLKFFAKYRLVEQFVRPGVANSTADFTLVYQ